MPHLLYILLFSFIPHHSTTYHLQPTDILDIDDYQFHFSTFHYEFTIQSSSASIQHPFDAHLNITLDIDFNSTISLSLHQQHRNLHLDFFNIDDFREISYTSCIQNTPAPSISRRHLISQQAALYPNPKIMQGSVNDISKALYDQAQTAVKQQRADASQPMGKSTPFGEDIHSLERQVANSIHRKVVQNSNNEWRNRMFDESMGNGPHPGFPSYGDWMKYHAFNQRPPPPPGMDPAFDAYRKQRQDALHRADQLFGAFHDNGDIALHDASSLKKRYEKAKPPKPGEFPAPPDTPSKVPYHHGRYIGIPERKSWFMAQQYCREQFGTNLASIMNENELKEIRHVCDEVAGFGHCWIGLHRPFGTWQDGKPVIMSNWGADGVNNVHETPLNCIEILYTDNMWNAQLCTVYRSFVCETPRKRTRGKYIAVGKTLSWESAENYCQQTYDTDLATISSEKENTLAMNLCRDISSDMHHCWVGLYHPFRLWTDGTHASYENFNTGEYIADHKGEDVFGLNEEEEPEPYGEDEEGDYPKAVVDDAYGDSLNGAINKDVDRLMSRVKRAEQHAITPEEEENQEAEEGSGLNMDDDKQLKERKMTQHQMRKQYETEGLHANWMQKKNRMKQEAVKRYAMLEERNQAKAKQVERDTGKCVEIDTSYGGIWDKARCGFRHFFLCNNPGYHATETVDEEYPEMLNTVKRKKKKRYKAGDVYKKKKRHRAEREEEEGSFDNYRRRLYADEKFNFGALAKKAGGMAKKALPGVMGAMGGMLGGGAGGGAMGDMDTMNRRHRRDKWRRKHEARSRWKRREARRRRRKRRRSRFMRWLKKHYGRGVRRSCGHHCPHRHIHIRTLPKDMHWSPLSGLLPMFGTRNIQYRDPKKGPKIHIVAKVHLPKHRAIKHELDYDLLNALLFGDDDKVRKQGSSLMNEFDKQQKKVEKLVAGQQDKNLLNKFNEDATLKKQLDSDAQYKKWDEANDDRMAQTDRRRMMENDDDDRWGDDVRIVSHCRIISDDDYGKHYDICMNYEVNEKIFSVDIKHMEYKIYREHKRRVFRDVLDENAAHYKDYEIEEEAEEEEAAGDYAFFEPIDGNLAFAIFQYESMDWHSIKVYEDELKNNKYKYGDFENFKHYIRFNQRFYLEFNKNNNSEECSVTLDGLPFKMCISSSEDQVVLYFEKDQEADVLDPVFSFQMKEFIDNEFEASRFVFDDDSYWDQVNIINMGADIEKCSFLHIAKICIKQNDDNGVMIASISFQFMNKAMPSIEQRATPIN